MVRHMVLWNLKPEMDKKTVHAEMLRIFHGFRADVPGLISLEVYSCFGGYDLCLISDHKDRAALEVYQQFPAHIAAKEYVHSVVQQRAHCDFEMNE